MDFYEELFQIAKMPRDTSKAGIAARRERLVKFSQELQAVKHRLGAEFDILYAMCDHSDSYSSNWCGRDPGGGGCNTCGKVW